MTMPERARMKVLREGLTFAFGFSTYIVLLRKNLCSFRQNIANSA